MPTYESEGQFPGDFRRLTLTQRAAFRYGSEQIPGETHIIWRRVGGHDIFAQP